jgi:hypothetical protein
VLVGEAKIPIFTVFGLTYHIVLKNDTLFVPSGQSLRSVSFFQVDHWQQLYNYLYIDNYSLLSIKETYQYLEEAETQLNFIYQKFPNSSYNLC